MRRKLQQAKLALILSFLLRFQNLLHKEVLLVEEALSLIDEWTILALLHSNSLIWLYNVQNLNTWKSLILAQLSNIESFKEIVSAYCEDVNSNIRMLHGKRCKDSEKITNFKSTKHIYFTTASRETTSVWLS